MCELQYHPESNRLQAFDKNENPVSDLNGKEVPQDKLADYVGKDVAEKLINAPKEDGWNVLRGADLKVGGEGMHAFYDKMLPNIANKIGKKFGAKVGTTKFKVDNQEWYPGQNMRDAWSLPITDAMRTQAQTKGFPLFSGGVAPVGAKKDDLNSILEELNQFKQ